MPPRARKIIMQRRPVVRVRAVVNDPDRAPDRGQSAQIGDALFGDDNLHVMIAVVNMRGQGNDAGNRAVLHHRRSNRGRC